VKRVKRLALLALAMVVALSIFAAPVAAKATKTSFKARLETPTPLGVEKVWSTNEERILHVRGEHVKRDITDLDGDGSFYGWEEVVNNVNLNLETLDGNAWGEVTLYVTWHDVEGIFEAHYSGQIRDGLIDGTVVGHGTGNFKGMKFMARFWDEEVPGEEHIEFLEGIVLDPHGG